MPPKNSQSHSSNLSLVSFRSYTPRQKLRRQPPKQLADVTACHVTPANARPLRYHRLPIDHPSRQLLRYVTQHPTPARELGQQ